MADLSRLAVDSPIARDLFQIEGKTVRASNRVSFTFDRATGEVVSHTPGGKERGRMHPAVFSGTEAGLRDAGMKPRQVLLNLSQRIAQAAPKKAPSLAAKRAAMPEAQRNRIQQAARAHGPTLAQQFKANLAATITNAKGETFRFDKASGLIEKADRTGKVLNRVSPARLHAVELAARERYLTDKANGRERPATKVDAWTRQRADAIQTAERQAVARQTAKAANDLLRKLGPAPKATDDRVSRVLAALDYDGKAPAAPKSRLAAMVEKSSQRGAEHAARAKPEASSLALSR